MLYLFKDMIETEYRKTLFQSVPMGTVISPANLRDLLHSDPSVKLVDVREPDEFATAHIETSINTPLTALSDAIPNFSQEDKIVFVCQTGKRSAQAMSFLQSIGFRDIYHLEGGLDAWNAAAPTHS